MKATGSELGAPVIPAEAVLDQSIHGQLIPGIGTGTPKTSRALLDPKVRQHSQVQPDQLTYRLTHVICSHVDVTVLLWVVIMAELIT